MSAKRIPRLYCLMTAASFLFLTATSIGNAEETLLTKGREFPLSNGVIARIIKVEVQRITSARTIDILVSFDRVGPATRQEALFTEVGELCLRYQDQITSAALPSSERPKINLFAPVYRISKDGKTAWQEFGFAFKLKNGACSLEPPFPRELVEQTLRAAKKPVK